MLTVITAGVNAQVTIASKGKSVISTDKVHLIIQGANENDTLFVPDYIGFIKIGNQVFEVKKTVTLELTKPDYWHPFGNFLPDSLSVYPQGTIYLPDSVRCTDRTFTIPSTNNHVMLAPYTPITFKIGNSTLTL